MAEELGMPASSYAFYEDKDKFKKTYLPVELARSLTPVFARHGIPESVIEEMAGLGERPAAVATDFPDTPPTKDELQLLAAFRSAPADQAQAAKALLQPAEDPHPNAPRIVELLVERASPKQLQSVVRILSGKSDEIDVQIAAEQLDLVPVASIDASYGMGATFLEDDIAVDTRWFPRAWLESVTNTAPGNLTWARGRGNSMSPTIEDQDLLLIDRSDLTVRDQDAIWALTIGEIGMLKRLRIRGEKVTILSDNERVPDDHAHIGEINIVGRVSHIVRRL
ncbi:MAG TPA: S24 family peptidase [Sphingomonas sp.]|nr:S24 family peptidase [Sphingomonas sp.]